MFSFLDKLFFQIDNKGKSLVRGFVYGENDRTARLLIPGGLAALGIKLMRDTVFGILIGPFQILWLQGLAGFICFAGGLYLLGGFILYRDRKRNQVSPRFRKKQSGREV